MAKPQQTTDYFREKLWDVIGTSTKQNTADSLFYLDLSKPESIKAFVQSINDKKVGVLIDNTGISLDFYADTVDIAKLRQTLEVNLIGTIDLTEQILSFKLLAGA